MSAQDDEDYYRGRAIEERIAAEDATQANVKLIHEELARLYEALANKPELRPAGLAAVRQAGGTAWVSSDAPGPA